ncbi:hypothetical protein SERLA73DRAFT_68562 [Serpula lacrymans var. lacrymans S7.3]|uniref:DUF6532 domain-containing protein n=1 Tax=Serpula lacrymans var. lacrymans (strain S7.3) TaxID=936435 RepID=F8PGU8_SERL3|nr:hypothetical protein SERLA73DRAFT_68562 [Serpula lacrymans var. lacrymans S7.3]
MASVFSSSAMPRKCKPILALFPPSLAQLAIEAHTQMFIESSKISNSFESKLREVEENEVLKIFMMDYVWPAGPQIRGKVVAKARLMINGAYGIPGDISPEKIKLAVRWLINTCTFTDGDLDIKTKL